jgi:hypothetical protein
LRLLFTRPNETPCPFTTAAAALVLLFGIAWILCPSRAEGKFPRLRVLRQSMEQGEPVVYFRVETQRKFQMTNIERVMGEISDNPGNSQHRRTRARCVSREAPLRKLLRDHNPQTRNSAVSAIRKIAP